MSETRIISFRDTASHLLPSFSPNTLVWGTQSKSFGLPPLNSNGLLPEGIHDSGLEELSKQFATSPCRRDLWFKCVTFLTIAAATNKFENAYIAGGFVTDKPLPCDVDLILETAASYGPQAFKAMEPFFAQGINTVLENYSVHLHFWCRGCPEDIQDFRDFFQYLRPIDAFTLGLPPETRKGIVRIKISGG